MRRTALSWVAVAAILIILSGCSGGVGTGGAGAHLSDDEFVRDVGLKNMAAMELSRIAVDKAASLDIKSFAQRVIDDHAAAADNLKSLLSERPIEWPAQLDDKYKETADELANEQGADFDRGYIQAMVEGHLDLAAKLESRLDVQSLSDWKTAAAARTHSKAMPEPEVLSDVQVRPSRSDNELTMKINQWAADTYPVAQKHLDTARRLEIATNQRSTN